MDTQELIRTNPLRVLGIDKIEASGRGLGLVMARAGLGKTAILVQIALDAMMRGQNVLHVAIGESLDKTRERYDDILAMMAADLPDETRTALARQRMIMTFKENVFSRAIFEERLTDMIQQNVFQPHCLIIDGYEFNDESRPAMEELKQLMATLQISVAWLSAVCHREDPRISSDGIPAPCHTIADLFEAALLINPADNVMNLDIIKCSFCQVTPGTALRLDPSTMLIQRS
ncbi:MAG: hypothetical protein N839_0010205 [Desulfofustis sp. PB-SRB1]|nr:hypothetical protein [Desulfofustis sp. PB-SRB1]